MRPWSEDHLSRSTVCWIPLGGHWGKPWLGWISPGHSCLLLLFRHQTVPTFDKAVFGLLQTCPRFQIIPSYWASEKHLTLREETENWVSAASPGSDPVAFVCTGQAWTPLAVLTSTEITLFLSENNGLSQNCGQDQRWARARSLTIPQSNTSVLNSLHFPQAKRKKGKKGKKKRKEKKKLQSL